MTTHNIVFLLASLAGLALLVARDWRRSGILWPCFLVGLLGVFFAVRFLIFLAPVLAVGSAYLFFRLWTWPRWQACIRCACVLWALLALLLPVLKVMRSFPAPKVTEPVAMEMADLRSSTPSASVVWAWWDYGHAIRFFSERATVNDGSIHSGSRTVYTAWPLCTTNERAAANFMRFYSVNGRSGIRQFIKATGLEHDAGFRQLCTILNTEPSCRYERVAAMNLAATGACHTAESWVHFLFPSTYRPLYLFLDPRTFDLAYWWYWFGTWSVDRREGVHPACMPLYAKRLQDDAIIFHNGSRFDSRQGILFRQGKAIPVEAIRVFEPEGQGREIRTFHHPGAPVLEISRGHYAAVLADPVFVECVFNKLFVRRQYDTRYFRPLAPGKTVWQVFPD